MDSDIVVDTNVIRLYGVAGDPVFKTFFAWLRSNGILACSQKLLVEYHRSGSSLVAGLVADLLIARRLRKYSPSEIESIRHGRYRFRSNRADHHHVKLVMRSCRRLCLSLDEDLRYDVNNFPGYGGQAASRPDEIPYR